MKRLSLDRKISRLSLNPPSSILTTFHPIMMKLPARKGKLLGLVRDKILSCAFFAWISSQRELDRSSNWLNQEDDLYLPRNMLVFWIQSAKLIFYLLPKINHLRSKRNYWKFNSRRGERRKAEESEGRQLESRIGMNYSRYLLGSSDPIDRFLSYFKSDAILREAKTISRNFSSSRYFSYSSNWERSNEKRARSKFYFIAIPNDRSLAIAKLFFWFAISCTILFFPGCEYFLWIWKRSFGKRTGLNDIF